MNNEQTIIGDNSGSPSNQSEWVYHGATESHISRWQQCSHNHGHYNICRYRECPVCGEEADLPITRHY